MTHHTTTRWSPAARIACIAVVIVTAGAMIGRAPIPANASPPKALELAEHALTMPVLLADESPYELIDPVGPGGITHDQAVDEVTASTMKGGLYNDNGRYGGGYGGQYFMPAQPILDQRGYGAYSKNSDSERGGYDRGNKGGWKR